MTRTLPRRLGALTAAIALTATLVAPGVAAGEAPRGASLVTPSAGSAAAAGDTVTRSALQDDPIQVRSLDDACPTDRVPSGGFGDSAGVYGRAIDCLVWYEITAGRTATAFEPNGTVNRRQMAVFLHRMLDDIVDLPSYGGSSGFADVPDEGFGSAEINVLASDEFAERFQVRIVSGRQDGRFDPGSRVTREQMGSFVARTLQAVANANEGTILPGSCGGPCFEDDDRIAPAHRDNVHLLFQFGIVTGRANGDYDPKGDVLRGQMALFLTRTLDVVVESGGTVPPDERS